MPSIDEIVGALQKIFGERAKALANEQGVNKRSSKITGTILALVLVTGFMSQPGASLNQLSQIAQQFGVNVTRSGLSQRLTSVTVEFLRLLFEEALQVWQQREGLWLELFEPFRGVYLIDSTHIGLANKLADSQPASGGQAGKAGMKLQITYDYLQQQVEVVTAQAALEPDQSFEDKLEKLPEGSLVLFDLGYCTLERLKRLMAAHYFVSRLPPKVHLYEQGSNQPLALGSELRRRGGTCAGTVIELRVEVGQKERLKLRVVAQVLPQEAYLQRLAQAKKVSQLKGRELSAATAERLRWNLYLTNVHESLLSGYQVGIVYHLRWQIELLFKLWKSGLGLAQSGNKKLSRVWCEIYARLIGYTLLIYLSWGVAGSEEMGEAEETNLVEALVGSSGGESNRQWQETDKAKLGRAKPLILQALIKTTRELSLTKALQTLGTEIVRLGKALLRGKDKKVKKLIKKLRKRWGRYSLKEKRADRLTSYQQISQIQLSTRELHAPDLTLICKVA
ncbi:MAG: IS4 family transposase [Chloroflexi bacterium]|uniref:IS4 family transposase n=1 Tax=Candidatus Chlorohelix allophototropha TaxID=3003348 RepID=A0A8T7M8T3_9CHLR|nr:IS4 family transposase [Chloroflexota bacterium]NWJ48464.1 IS4 family transposase [Chloroflexota bacterium]NWJ48505.1 IS4 family transposase [Chloroflexota bacterium]WJW66031.1 IS4 family transposase [Chloroflexota bacterium L227-S17]WJW68397.1 IS4 family transposase [Chloroflexota bacterium L227-S17]